MKWCIKILKLIVFDYPMEIPMVLAQDRSSFDTDSRIGDATVSVLFE